MNVLKPHLRITIETLLERGATQREIERITGVDRKTIRRYARALANSPGVATGSEATARANSPTPATGSGSARGDHDTETYAAQTPRPASRTAPGSRRRSGSGATP